MGPRMARMAKLLRAMPELMILIKGMVAACRSMFFTLCLLALIMFVFGIAFKQMAAEYPIGRQYFHSVPSSMYSLLIHGTLLDSVGVVADAIGQESFMLSV